MPYCVSNNSVKTPSIEGAGEPNALMDESCFLTQNIKNIFNLPLEIKSKIAKMNDAKCYANFSSVNKMMHNDLASIKTIFDNLVNSRYTGETKKVNESMFEPEVISLYRNEIASGEIELLKSVHIDHTDKYIFIKSTYNQSTERPFYSILERCRDELDKNMRDEKPRSFIIIGRDLEANAINTEFVQLWLHRSDLNAYTINILFDAFNSIFNKYKADERLLVAISAYKFKNYLISNNINGLDKTIFNKYLESLSRLFTAGEMISNYLSSK